MMVAKSSKFDPRLESLRGLAALAVVVAHSMGVLKVDGLAAHWKLPLTEQSPASFKLLTLSAIFNPGGAVVLFFVLSGFVLSLSWTAQAPVTYFARRLTRLLPPMWASIFVSAAILYLFPPIPSTHLAEWATHAFLNPSLRSLASNLILKQCGINGVTWTMYVEIIGSAFIPIAIYARGKIAVALLIFTSALAIFAHQSHTLSYLVCFQFGVLLARREPAIHTSWAWLAIIIFIFDRFCVQTGGSSTLLNCLASYILIAAIRRGAWSNLLNSKALRFVGKVSFSLYLFHPIILFIISRNANKFAETGILPHLLIMAITIPASLLLAGFAYHTFEKPSINFGKKIAIWINLRKNNSLSCDSLPL